MAKRAQDATKPRKCERKEGESGGESKCETGFQLSVAERDRFSRSLVRWKLSPLVFGFLPFLLFSPESCRHRHIHTHTHTHEHHKNEKETRRERVRFETDAKTNRVYLRRLFPLITTRRLLIFSSVGSILLEQSGTLNFSSSPLPTLVAHFCSPLLVTKKAFSRSQRLI